MHINIQRNWDFVPYNKNLEIKFSYNKKFENKLPVAKDIMSQNRYKRQKGFEVFISAYFTATASQICPPPNSNT